MVSTTGRLLRSNNLLDDRTGTVYLLLLTNDQLQLAYRASLNTCHSPWTLQPCEPSRCRGGHDLL